MTSTVKDLIASRPDWLDHLVSEYKIIASHDDGLVSLKYNQFESPMDHPLVQQCRGMVVEVATGKILAHPYNKFWNHGEPGAAQIDWSAARVLEKLDGSLMILYWHNDAWQVASSGTPRAGGTFGDTGETFRDAFWRTFRELGMATPEHAVHRDWCFMFEFCDAPNRIVVRHDRPRIVLHGARHLTTGHEPSAIELGWMSTQWNWELVRSYPITSIEECLAAAEALEPMHGEGFVVVDSKFNRVKIKSPRYVRLHQLKGEMTPRRAIELWQTGETSELLTYFPEMGDQIRDTHERLAALAEFAFFATKARDHLDRKTFALEIKNLAVAPVAFKLYGRTPRPEDAVAIMRGMTLPALERMLEAAK